MHSKPPLSLQVSVEKCCLYISETNIFLSPSLTHPLNTRIHTHLHVVCQHTYAYTHTHTATHLEENYVIFSQFIIMFDLDSYGLVTVDVAQLYVSRVGHEEGSIEPSWAESCAGTNPHHCIEAGATRDTAPEVLYEPLSISTGLQVGRGGGYSHIKKQPSIRHPLKEDMSLSSGDWFWSQYYVKRYMNP